MDDLRKEYYGRKGEEPPPRAERIRHRLMLGAIRRTPELAALENLSEDDLIKAYYEGTIPRSRKQKTRLLQVLEMPKNRERWAGSPARGF
jgi:hypothetical protein